MATRRRTNTEPARGAGEVEQAHHVIIGGGLAGSLMALFLARRGYRVDVLERRPDPRTAEVVEGRSINLALSERGLNALRAVGLEHEVRALCLPMHGRIVHDADGAVSRQPYGQPGQHINSISRRALNELLIRAADAHPQVRMHFDVEIEALDLDEAVVTWRTRGDDARRRTRARLLIGADGAFSQVRAALQRTPRYNYSQSFLDYGYKELTLPPNADGGHALSPDGLHIWPRHDYMLIALPNLDGTFTCTLFLPWEGETSFDSLKDGRGVRAFFEANFPDAAALLPDLEEQFAGNPVGSMVTISCDPWHYGDRVVLIGDAAHAIVPFYGQGMNAAFEDCFELDRLFAQLGAESQAEVVRRFSSERKRHADAIRDLAHANFVEMRSRVVKQDYLLRRQVEQVVQLLFPNRFSAARCGWGTAPGRAAQPRAGLSGTARRD